ncbi:MAG: hypothetical protein KME32_23105 [Mojavia pulchra JT2-VF2]|jgi:hypothetical protein|uniref:Uncharacterized protein n=1 Tax=Mojavia pulchra JT2-VF2 TaxID=287848 RepID=A0A951UJ36_9NOST|nr:hypothetical protein [Mojavia pulchra JT2-VF2]
MTTNFSECISRYINTEYRQGGLIGLSTLAAYCKTSEGKIIVALTDLQSRGEVEIIKRYFCPDAHFISLEKAPYCQVCDYNYSENFITTIILVKPLHVARNSN